MVAPLGGRRQLKLDHCLRTEKPVKSLILLVFVTRAGELSCQTLTPIQHVIDVLDILEWGSSCL